MSRCQQPEPVTSALSATEHSFPPVVAPPANFRFTRARTRREMFVVMSETWTVKTERPRCDKTIFSNPRRAAGDSTEGTHRASGGKSTRQSAPPKSRRRCMIRWSRIRRANFLRTHRTKRRCERRAAMIGAILVVHRNCACRYVFCSGRFEAYLNVHSFSANRFAVQREIVPRVLASPHYRLTTIH